MSAMLLLAKQLGSTDTTTTDNQTTTAPAVEQDNYGAAREQLPAGGRSSSIGSYGVTTRSFSDGTHDVSPEGPSPDPTVSVASNRAATLSPYGSQSLFSPEAALQVLLRGSVDSAGCSSSTASHDRTERDSPLGCSDARGTAAASLSPEPYKTLFGRDGANSGGTFDAPTPATATKTRLQELLAMATPDVRSSTSMETAMLLSGGNQDHHHNHPGQGSASNPAPSATKTASDDVVTECLKDQCGKLTQLLTQVVGEYDTLDAAYTKLKADHGEVVEKLAKAKRQHEEEMGTVNRGHEDICNKFRATIHTRREEVETLSEELAEAKRDLVDQDKASSERVEEVNRALEAAEARAGSLEKENARITEELARVRAEKEAAFDLLEQTRTDAGEQIRSVFHDASSKTQDYERKFEALSASAKVEQERLEAQLATMTKEKEELLARCGTTSTENLGMILALQQLQQSVVEAVNAAFPASAFHGTARSASPVGQQSTPLSGAGNNGASPDPSDPSGRPTSSQVHLASAVDPDTFLTQQQLLTATALYATGAPMAMGLVGDGADGASPRMVLGAASPPLMDGARVETGLGGRRQQPLARRSVSAERASSTASSRSGRSSARAPAAGVGKTSRTSSSTSRAQVAGSAGAHHQPQLAAAMQQQQVVFQVLPCHADMTGALSDATASRAAETVTTIVGWVSQRLKDARGAAANMKAMLKQSRGDVDEAGVRLRQLEDQRLALQQRLDEAVADFKNQKAEMDTELRRHCDEHEHELAMALMDQKREREDHAAALKRTEKDANDAREEFDGLRRRVVELEGEVAEGKRELAWAERRRTEATNELTAVAKQRDDLQEEVSQATESGKQLRVELSAASEQRVKLGRRVTTLSAQNVKLERESKELEEKLKTVSSEKHDLHTKLQTKTRRSETAATAADQKQAALEKQFAKEKELSERQAREKMVGLETKWRAKCKEYANTAKDASDKLQLVEKERDELRSEVAGITAQRREAESRLVLLCRTVQRLVEQCRRQPGGGLPNDTLAEVGTDLFGGSADHGGHQIDSPSMFDDVPRDASAMAKEAVALFTREMARLRRVAEVSQDDAQQLHYRLNEAMAEVETARDRIAVLEQQLANSRRPHQQQEQPSSGGSRRMPQLVCNGGTPSPSPFGVVRESPSPVNTQEEQHYSDPVTGTGHPNSNQLAHISPGTGAAASSSSARVVVMDTSPSPMQQRQPNSQQPSGRKPKPSSVRSQPPTLSDVIAQQKQHLAAKRVASVPHRR